MSGRLTVFLALVVFFTSMAPAQETPGVLVPAELIQRLEKSDSPPLRLAEKTGLEPAATLARAETAVPSELEAVAQWNQARLQPTKIGVFRTLGVPLEVSLGQDSLAKGAVELDRALVRKTSDGLVWTSRVQVEGAWGLRARLKDADLPPGTELWVYGESENFVYFGPELLRPDGDLWTPSIGGEVLNLEIRVPDVAWESGSKLSFQIDRVAQLFQLDASGAPLLEGEIVTKECTEDAACWNEPEAGFRILKRATSYLEVIGDDFVGACSGILLNDLDPSTFIPPPYMLTALTCINDQGDARSATFYFDYIASSCNGPTPDLFDLPRVDGSTLWTGGSPDTGLIELHALPGGERGFAGWAARFPGIFEMLHTFSHPLGRSMRYSQAKRVSEGNTSCELDREEYLISDQVVGAIQAGSLGAGVANEDFQVIALAGMPCGIDPDDGCDWELNDQASGWISLIADRLEHFLSPEAVTECIGDVKTMCLNANRFEVKSNFRGHNGENGEGNARELTSDTGYFWFFDRENVEVVIKVLDACERNGHFWVFAGGLTDVEVELIVHDTVTDRTWSGSNRFGEAFETITDTRAIPCD